MPFRQLEEPAEGSSFSLFKLRAAASIRRQYKSAEIVRCQVVYLPDTFTAMVLTPNLTYRYVRMPANAVILPGDYVSVLDPGGESSGKNLEIINVVSAASASGVSTLNNMAGYLTVYAGPGVQVTDYALAKQIMVHLAYQPITFGITFDGGGAVISTGVKGDLRVPWAGEITGWTILADQTGSITVDIWKDSYTNFPPTVADSITASAKPALTSQDKNRDTTLTGWTKTFNLGDTFRFNVTYASYVTRASLIIEGTRIPT